MEPLSPPAAMRESVVSQKDRSGGALLYQWWVFIHIVGVLGFLLAHGVSVAVLFALRRERDPGRIRALLALSGQSANAFYWSFLVASRDPSMLTQKVPSLAPGGNFFHNAARVFNLPVPARYR